jgi:addiction module HigA family antidote
MSTWRIITSEVNFMIMRKRLPPTHPGELLRTEILPAAGLTQEELAAELHVSRFTINQILRERRNVTADMAWRLAMFFDTTPELWTGLQQDVDLWEVFRNSEAGYRKVKPRRKTAA